MALERGLTALGAVLSSNQGNGGEALRQTQPQTNDR